MKVITSIVLMSLSVFAPNLFSKNCYQINGGWEFEDHFYEEKDNNEYSVASGLSDIKNTFNDIKNDKVNGNYTVNFDDGTPLELLYFEDLSTCIKRSYEAFTSFEQFYSGSKKKTEEYKELCFAKNAKISAQLEELTKQKEKLSKDIKITNKKLEQIKEGIKIPNKEKPFFSYFCDFKEEEMSSKIPIKKFIDCYAQRYKKLQAGNLWYAYYKSPELRAERAKKIISGGLDEVSRLMRKEKNDLANWEPKTRDLLDQCIYSICSSTQGDDWSREAENLQCIVSKLYIPARQLDYIIMLYTLPSRHMSELKVYMQVHGVEKSDLGYISKHDEDETCCDPDIDFDILKNVIDNPGICPTDTSTVDDDYKKWSLNCKECWNKYREYRKPVVHIVGSNTGKDEIVNSAGENLSDIKYSIEHSKILSDDSDGIIGGLLYKYNENKNIMSSLETKTLELEKIKTDATKSDSSCSKYEKQKTFTEFAYKNMNIHREEFCYMYNDLIEQIKNEKNLNQDLKNKSIRYLCEKGYSVDPIKTNEHTYPCEKKLNNKNKTQYLCSWKKTENKK